MYIQSWIYIFIAYGPRQNCHSTPTPSNHYKSTNPHPVSNSVLMEKVLEWKMKTKSKPTIKDTIFIYGLANRPYWTGRFVWWYNILFFWYCVWSMLSFTAFIFHFISIKHFIWKLSCILLRKAWHSGVGGHAT